MHGPQSPPTPGYSLARPRGRSPCRSWLDPRPSETEITELRGPATRWDNRPPSHPLRCELPALGPREGRGRVGTGPRGSLPSLPTARELVREAIRVRTSRPVCAQRGRNGVRTTVPPAALLLPPQGSPGTIGTCPRCPRSPLGRGTVAAWTPSWEARRSEPDELRVSLACPLLSTSWIVDLWDVF